MHNRKVFVLKDLLYAASKSGNTVNTALSPADLRDGAIGVYGIHRAGATNLNKHVLITDGGSEVAGSVPMATFVGDQICIGFGVASGNNQLSNYIDKTTLGGNGLKAAVGKKYTAPVLGVQAIGYNGVAGSSMNLPATIVGGEDFTIKMIDRNSVVSGFRSPYAAKTVSVAAAIGDTGYTLARKWIAALNTQPDGVIPVDKAKARILGNGTGAVFTTTATATVVNGSATVTTSAAHGVTAGDYVSLGGDIYLTIAGTTGSTIVLDRPYQGASATIANANTLDITGAATTFGIELTDDQVGRNLDLSASGLLANATQRIVTSALLGNGTQAQVAEMELEARPKKGSHDQINRYMDLDPIRASGNYDLYILTIQNANHPTGQQGSVFKVINYLTLAFVENVADTATFAQSDFEDIMQQLFGATFPSVSA